MKIINPDEAVGKFGRWLAYNIFVRGMSVGDFARDIGLSRLTVSNHIHRKRKPSVDIVRIYCDYFGEGDMWRVYDTILDDYIDDLS